MYRKALVFSKSVTTVVITLLALLYIGVGCSERAEVRQQKKISVLFTGYRHHSLSHTLAQRFMERGFQVDETEQSLEKTVLNYEELKRYNVVVLMGVGLAHADKSLKTINKENIAVLLRYIKEGGGILFNPSFIQNLSALTPQEHFASELGLTLLFDELVSDSASAQATAYTIPFAYTDVVRKHPVTEGIAGIWYPVNIKAGGQLHTITYSANEQWEELIAGGATSFTQKVPVDTYYKFSKNPLGHYRGEVPLAAVRSYGKGRIGLWSIAPEYIFGDQAEKTLEGVVFNGGIGERGSDGVAFVENMLRYCAEPSLNLDGFGGAPMNKKVLIDPLKITTWNPPYNWQRDRKPSPLPALLGVVGARTSRTSGRNSVAEWVATAKKEGLSFIVFLEEFSALSPAEFASLKEECKAQSSESFKAIAGFTIDDEIGNHYFYYGDIPYPPEKLLDKTGKVFASKKKRGKKKGQLAITTLEYVHGESSLRLTAGNYLFKSDASLCANWFTSYDVIGVFTARNGERKEDALAEYLTLVDAGQWAFPVAVELMDSVEFLTKNTVRTVLKLKGADEIEGFWNKFKIYPSNPTKLYITEGPAIDLWAMSGPRDYVGTNRGDFVWQNLRWNIYGKVSSEWGVREVSLYDGERLFRRFDAGGEREFEFSLKLNHDKQHNLVVVVHDMDGKRAISSEQIDRNHRFQEYQCGDRCNQLSYARTYTAQGLPVSSRGRSTPNKRVDSISSISPAGRLQVATSAFDGGVPEHAPVYHQNVVLFNGTQRVLMPKVVESRRLLHTGDVNMGQAECRWNFVDDIPLINVWYTLWRAEDAEVFTARKRITQFPPDPEKPILGTLWEYEFELLQECPDHRGFELGSIEPKTSTGWVARSAQGKMAGGLWQRDASGKERVVLDDAGYLAMTGSPDGAMALFSLTPGVYASVDRTGKGRTRLYLAGDSLTRAKGGKIRVSLLFVGVHRSMVDAESDGDFIASWARGYGLAPASIAPFGLAVEAGSIEKIGYPLQLALDEKGGCRLSFSEQFYGSFPVVLSGGNDRWSAFFYDYTLGKSRPVALYDNRIWVTLPAQEKSRVAIVHPITADNRDLFIQLSQIDSERWEVEFHNPTTTEMRTRAQISPYFEPLRGVALPEESLRLKAGESLRYQLHR
jgi:hypothetical protein